MARCRTNRGSLPLQPNVDYLHAKYVPLRISICSATFDRNDLKNPPGSTASDTAIAKKFGGARAIWDAGVCNETQSHHVKPCSISLFFIRWSFNCSLRYLWQMCIGPCDAWQPRDPVTKLPVLEPVWRYLVISQRSRDFTDRVPSFLRSMLLQMWLP